MLQPKRTRYRKHHKPSRKSPVNNTLRMVFGDYGIQAMESGCISARHLEAVRRVCTRLCKRQGKIWLRLYPDLVVTRKSAESRMGKGKGAPAFWVAPVSSGGIILEMSGMPFETAKAAARMAKYKLPIQTRFVTRAGIAG
jgi:large subunit ribosomal protein L16